VDYRPWPDDGCTLAEARERTADRKAWQALSKHSDGDAFLDSSSPDAASRTERQGARCTDERTAPTPRTEQAINFNFQQLLGTSRLIAYGRKGSLRSPPERLPADVWSEFIDTNWDVSSVKDPRRGGTVFYDIRVFPATKAPCRIDLLAGQTLTEAFRRFILEDPEVAALATLAIERAPEYVRTYKDGRCHPNGEKHWPLLVKSCLAGILSPDSRMSAMGRAIEYSTPEEVLQAGDALRDRFNALFGMLRRGDLQGRGILASDGSGQPIIRSIWSHADFYVDATTGDILQEIPKLTEQSESFIQRWIGVVLTGSPIIPAPAIEPHVLPNNEAPFSSDDVYEAGSLADALTRLVFKHPAVLALRNTAILAKRRGGSDFDDDAGLIGPGYGHEEPLIPLRYFKPEREHFGSAPAEDAIEPDHEAYEFYGPTEPDEADHYHDAVMSRARAFFKLLQDQKVRCLGHTMDGHLIPITRSIWSHEDFYVHPYTGDLYEGCYGGEMVKRWIGVVFDPAQSRSSPKVEVASELIVIKVAGRGQASIGAITECKNWLVAEMTKNPTHRPRKKADWRQNAKAEWGSRLSGRGFDRAWDHAIAETGAVAWSSAGAPPGPRKNHRTQNPRTS